MDLPFVSIMLDANTAHKLLSFSRRTASNKANARETTRRALHDYQRLHKVAERTGQDLASMRLMQQQINDLEAESNYWGHLASKLEAALGE